jgi:potassium/hydrogen antiporter
LLDLTDTKFALVLVGTGALLTAAFITTNLSRRFGLPSLLLYLGLGLFLGNGGAHDFLFDDPKLVERCAELALGLILFKGGYEFRQSLWKKPRVLCEGVALAIIGTLLTALVTATAVRYCFGWGWLEAMLLGSVLSSTDAAAVFSVFKSSGLRTRKHSMEVLELESSTNDPLAYGLVVGLVGALQGPDFTLRDFVLLVTKGLCFGLVVGGIVGFVLLGLTRLVRQRKGTAELLWLAVLTSALGLAELTGANPLITAFMAGVVLSTGKEDEGDFWGPLVVLSEVVLFLLLGLQIFPAVLWQNLGPALLVTAFLVLVSRPLAVFAVSPFFEKDLRRSLFISWAGLRGASPIVFGLLPVIAGVPKAQEIFATVFAVVVVSVLLQGTTLQVVAKKLDVAEGQHAPDG